MYIFRHLLCDIISNNVADYKNRPSAGLALQSITGERRYRHREREHIFFILVCRFFRKMAKVFFIIKLRAHLTSSLVAPCHAPCWSYKEIKSNGLKKWVKFIQTFFTTFATYRKETLQSFDLDGHPVLRQLLQSPRALPTYATLQISCSQRIGYARSKLKKSNIMQMYGQC